MYGGAIAEIDEIVSLTSIAGREMGWKHFNAALKCLFYRQEILVLPHKRTYFYDEGNAAGEKELTVLMYNEGFIALRTMKPYYVTDTLKTEFYDSKNVGNSENCLIFVFI